MNDNKLNNLQNIHADDALDDEYIKYLNEIINENTEWEKYKDKVNN